MIVGDFNITPEEYQGSAFQHYFINPLLESSRQIGRIAEKREEGGDEVEADHETRFVKSSCFKPELMYRLWENRMVRDENVIVDYALVYKNDMVKEASFSAQAEIVDAEEVLAINWSEGEASEAVLDPRRALSDHLPLVMTLKV